MWGHDLTEVYTLTSNWMKTSWEGLHDPNISLIPCFSPLNTPWAKRLCFCLHWLQTSPFFFSCPVFQNVPKLYKKCFSKVPDPPLDLLHANRQPLLARHTYNGDLQGQTSPCSERGGRLCRVGQANTKPQRCVKVNSSHFHFHFLVCSLTKKKRQACIVANNVTTEEKIRKDGKTLSNHLFKFVTIPTGFQGGERKLK